MRLPFCVAMVVLLVAGCSTDNLNGIRISTMGLKVQASPCDCH